MVEIPKNMLLLIANHLRCLELLALAVPHAKDEGQYDAEDTWQWSRWASDASDCLKEAEALGAETDDKKN